MSSDMLFVICHVVCVVQNALKLSDEQIQDLMFVRRMDYTKHSLLDSQREPIAARIQEYTPNPVANVNKLSALAAEIQQQALEDHDTVHRVSWAVHCGVRCDSTCHVVE